MRHLCLHWNRPVRATGTNRYILDLLVCTIIIALVANHNFLWSCVVGRSGVALLLQHIASKLCTDSPADKSQGYLKRALKLLEPALSHLDTHKPTFLCGAGGPLAIGTVLLNKLGDNTRANDCVEKLKRLYTEHKPSFAKLPSEILFGQCGYLYGLLFVRAHQPRLIEDDLIAEVVSLVLDIGERQREAMYASPVMYTWHGKHYLGAAHGLTGILTLLLQVTLFLSLNTTTLFSRTSMLHVALNDSPSCASVFESVLANRVRVRVRVMHIRLGFNLPHQKKIGVPN